MNLNPAKLLNPVFDALDDLIADDGVYLYLVFVWLALALIGWIFNAGLRKRIKENSATVIPAVIIVTQSPMQSLPPTIDVEVEQTWNDGNDTRD